MTAIPPSVSGPAGQTREVNRICTERLRDVEQILGGIHDWIRAHPERIYSAI